MLPKVALSSIPGVPPANSQGGSTLRAAGRWLAVVPLILAVAWLLPNHTQPWAAFHSEAWAAGVLCLVAWGVLLSNEKLAISALDVLIASAALLPAAHYAAGLLPFAGQAWTAFAYLLAFLLAVCIGRIWNSWRPDHMADFLFASFLMASMISVGLQLYQWAGLTADQTVFSIWVLGFAGSRPFGNLAQPNQLATLHLWGLLACGWCVHRRHVRPSIGFATASFVLLGLALTQSRSGFLGFFVILLASWRWRKLWRNQAVAYGVWALIPVYLLALATRSWMDQEVVVQVTEVLLERTTGDMRLPAWAMFLDAIGERPWAGYGWNQSLSAHLAVIERHPDFDGLFGHAHNIALDLVVWAGIPLGLAFACALAAWVWTAWRRAQTPRQALFWLVAAALLVHAMLELPLHYAYFLLPLGLVMGALSGEAGIWILSAPSRGARRAAIVLLAGATLLLAVLVHDYFKAEASTTELRFKHAKIWNPVPPQAPDLALLTQFRAMLVLGFSKPGMKPSPQELQDARDVTAAFITYQNLDRLIRLLVLNGNLTEARCWAYKAGHLLTQEGVKRITRTWRELQEANPQQSLGPWPDSNAGDSLCVAARASPLGPWPRGTGG
jgi:O-antigen ligase